MADHGTGDTMGQGTYYGRSELPKLKKSAGPADELCVMADVSFAPPLQRLTPPSPIASVPPPPPPVPAPVAAPTPAPVPPALRLSAPVPVVQNTNSVPAVSLHDFLQPTKTDVRPSKKKKKKRGKKLLTMIVFLGLVGGVGYFLRDAAPVQKLLGHQPPIAPLPDTPMVRPNLTSAEYTVTLSAVENGVPKNVTTKVQEDFANRLGQSTVESQSGGTFTTTREIRTAEVLFRPGQAYGKEWSRQPRAPEAPSPFDTADFIPMVDNIVDMPLRQATKPTKSKSKETDGVNITTLTYVLDRAQVPEIAPAIFARVPWLFDVPNATTLTVQVSYDDSGLIRHLFLGVDPPQPGTGVGATWVTGYLLDVASINAPVSVVIPLDVIDVPAGTP